MSKIEITDEEIKKESIQLHYDAIAMGASSDSWERGFIEGAKWYRVQIRSLIEQYAEDEAIAFAKWLDDELVYIEDEETPEQHYKRCYQQFKQQSHEKH